MRLRDLTTALLLVLSLALLGCDDAAAPGGVDAAAMSPLPFGLAQVDGTAPVGRPAVYEDTVGTFKGVPVRGQRLQAVYLVDDDQDPVEAFRRWVDQLSVLPLDRVDTDDGPLGQWLTASGGSAGAAGEPRATARLELWAAVEGALLAVDVFVQQGVAPDQPVVPDVPDVPRPSPGANAPAPDSGEVLFVEKSDSVLVPEGAQALIGTLPRPGGEGGSTSLFTAEDADAAVDSILEQASERTGLTPEVVQRDVTVEDGVTIRQLDVSFGSAWRFDLVAVQGADDAQATVYVSTGSL